jgi:tetratricopeptide (TPR) repeat protein
MANFLQESKILLISSHTSHRSGLRKTLVDMGVNNKSIQVASDFQQAKDILEKGRINILVSDEDIGKGHFATDLLELHRKNNPVSDERFFLLMMDSEVTPFILADFILKGGDMSLSKPFKNASFIEILQKLIEKKSNLTPDDKGMHNIEDLIAVGDCAQAQEALKKIKNQESVQYFYANGLIAEAQGKPEHAFEHFIKSNEIKPAFKALVSVVRIGSKLKKYSELKKSVEVWLYEFPIHHSSLPDITRVIIANKKYELLDKLFKTIDNLVKAGDPVGAESAYLKNTPEVKTVEDQVLDLKIRGIIYPKSKLLLECMKLLEQKIVHPELFSLIINCMKEVGKDPGEIIVKAKRSYPDMDFR